MKLLHYKDSRLKKVCVSETATLRKAMAVMNQSSLRLIPVLKSGSQELVGVLADGDIRRYLAADGNVDDPVIAAANTRPRIHTCPLKPQNAQSAMQLSGVEYLPVVQDGIMTDLYVLWAVNAPSALTAVIMAGGLGSRLAPHTDECPKPLVELGGKPILTHIIENLRDQGVRKFVLCLNYLGQMIVDHYGDGSALNVDILYVHENKRLGTGGALSLVSVDQLSDPFLCMNGDILTDVDANALYETHLASDWFGTMVTRDFQYQVPYGVIRRDDGGGFEGSDEKPSLSFPINAGIYMLSKNVLPFIPQDTFYDLPTLFNELIKTPQSAGTYGHDGRWIDIGSVSELERARRIFESRAS